MNQPMLSRNLKASSQHSLNPKVRKSLTLETAQQPQLLARALQHAFWNLVGVITSSAASALSTLCLMAHSPSIYAFLNPRSEERRVGKECRSLWSSSL